MFHTLANWRFALNKTLSVAKQRYNNRADMAEARPYEGT